MLRPGVVFFVSGGFFNGVFRNVVLGVFTALVLYRGGLLGCPRCCSSNHRILFLCGKILACPGLVYFTCVFALRPPVLSSS